MKKLFVAALSAVAVNWMVARLSTPAQISAATSGALEAPPCSKPTTSSASDQSGWRLHHIGQALYAYRVKHPDAAQSLSDLIRDGMDPKLLDCPLPGASYVYTAYSERPDRIIVYESSAPEVGGLALFGDEKVAWIDEVQAKIALGK